MRNDDVAPIDRAPQWRRSSSRIVGTIRPLLPVEFATAYMLTLVGNFLTRFRHSWRRVTTENARDRTDNRLWERTVKREEFQSYDRLSAEEGSLPTTRGESAIICSEQATRGSTSADRGRDDVTL